MHLDRGGRVLAANAPALDILRRGDGLSDRDGALCASLPADHSRLQRLLKRALPGVGNEPPSGGSITIQQPLLLSRLALHVHPVAAAQADFGGRRVAALVLVVDPQRRPRIDPVGVSALLGLTPSEGRVSALLAEGRAVREIAATTGYQESYVRWLLKQVYQKQRLSGQVALCSVSWPRTPCRGADGRRAVNGPLPSRFPASPADPSLPPIWDMRNSLSPC